MRTGPTGSPRPGATMAKTSEWPSALAARNAELLEVLKMVDDNNRADEGEDVKSWRHSFVVSEVRRVLREHNPC
jgi:hypothetical protein